MGIQSVLKSYENYLNNGDIAGILELYGKEPVFMPQHAPALVGRQAVKAGYEGVFKSIQLDIVFSVHEVQEQGDWAWARTSSAGTVKVLANGHSGPESNNELFVFRKESGEWKIHRYIFSTTNPPK
jgi:uncharacterized protein (TIGR02246 family)